MDDTTTGQGHGEKLSRLGSRALAMLLVHDSITAAAAAVPIGERTLRRWLKLPSFRKRFLAMTQATVDHSIAKMNEATSAAAAVIFRSMSSDNPVVALRAATEIMNFVATRQDSAELQQRVLDLERLEKERPSHADRQSGNGQEAQGPGAAGGPGPSD